MIGKTLAHYKILGKLGEGGMGEVYKAEDTRLKRFVALKFLRPQSFGSDEHRERFIREAQIAASLDHPNICTIYEIDEAADQLFISMAYIEGIDLKEKIRSGPLELGEALDIAIQMAQGLEAAHRKGVIHRDIKSANVMVTENGQAKITDFGLAKIPGATEISKVWMTVGTAAYMSPEQTRGETVDHRTDIWSLGVVLYEMLTGELPFRGDYEAAVAYAILNEEPIPVSALRPEVPVGLEQIVERSLAKDREERYQSVSDLLEQLLDPKGALAFEKPAPTVSTDGLQPSIAVLPFADMSPKRDQEYFCDGMAEEIINALAKVEGLHVAARTSSFFYKGRAEDIRQIGKKLNVGTLLEGSVRKAGSRLRITAQLTNAADGYHIWSEQFDRELKDIFRIQEEIAQSIVQVLRVELSDREKRAIEKAPTRDIEAYDFYLRGRKYFYKTKRDNIDNAREMFSKAIEKDPDYARAYAGIADCYSYLYMYFDRSGENLEQAMAAGRKALELDPELAEAHAARGLALSLDKRYDEAEREFDKAIKLNPQLFEAYYFYARACFAQGKLERTAQLYEMASQVNPEDYQALSLLGFTYRTLGLMDRSEAAYRRSLKSVEQHLEFNPDDSRAFYLGSTALLELGDREKAVEWAMRALSLDPDDPYNLYGIACFYSRLGNVEESIRLFERALERGFSHREWIEHDSDLDLIRGDPRFQNLLKKLK